MPEKRKLNPYNVSIRREVDEGGERAKKQKLNKNGRVEFYAARALYQNHEGPSIDTNSSKGTKRVRESTFEENEIYENGIIQGKGNIMKRVQNIAHDQLAVIYDRVIVEGQAKWQQEINDFYRQRMENGNEEI